MKKKLIVLAVMVCLYAGPAVAWGTLIEIGLTARVYEVDDTANLLAGKIQMGDLITGVYRYDSATVDSNPDPSVGSYWHNVAPYGIELNVNGLEFKSDPQNMDFTIGLFDNTNLGNDSYWVFSRNNISNITSTGIDYIEWQLTDPLGNTINSTILPNNPPELPSWPNDGNLQIYSKKEGPNFDSFSIYSNIETVALVPEPISISFLLIGLFGINFKKRKQLS